MSNRGELPTELLWQPDHHVTDVVVTAVADGERAIVPQVAIEHIDLCPSCTHRVGEAALLSMEAGAALHALPATQLAAYRVRRVKLPIGYLAVALAVACLGMAPRLAQAPAWFGDASAWVVQSYPVVVRSGALIVRAAPQQLLSALTLLSFCSALVLVVMGTIIARAVPRALSVKGGVR